MQNNTGADRTSRSGPRRQNRGRRNEPHPGLNQNRQDFNRQGDENRTPAEKNLNRRKNRKFIKRNKSKKQKRTIEYNTVVNISTYNLSKPQTSLLNKGLGFCPTPPTPDPINILRDTYLFNRTLRLKHRFQGEQYTPPENKQYKQASGWTPKASLNKELDRYINVVTEEITNYVPTKISHRKKNLHQEDFKAIQELRNNKDIVIKPADKGGAVVVMDKKDYLTEAYRQLNDTSIYN